MKQYATLVPFSGELNVPVGRVEPTYVYSYGYSRAKPIEEQLRSLREHLGLSFRGEDMVSNTVCSYPPHIEGPFTVPKWQTVGKTYEEAFLKVLDAIGRQREFFNYCLGKLDANRLRLINRTTRFLEKHERNGQDLMVILAQFGKHHSGQSSCGAIEGVSSNEYELDPFSVAVMLLTHPERLQRDADPGVGMPGCEYDYRDGDPPWSHILCFLFANSTLYLTHRRRDLKDKRFFGTVSGFLLPTTTTILAS